MDDDEGKKVIRSFDLITMFDQLERGDRIAYATGMPGGAAVLAVKEDGIVLSAGPRFLPDPRSPYKVEGGVLLDKNEEPREYETSVGEVVLLKAASMEVADAYQRAVDLVATVSNQKVSRDDFSQIKSDNKETVDVVNMIINGRGPGKAESKTEIIRAVGQAVFGNDHEISDKQAVLLSALIGEGQITSMEAIPISVGGVSPLDVLSDPFGLLLGSLLGGPKVMQTPNGIIILG